MMRLIDRILDRFTMYRLTLYYLIALVALGLVLSVFGIVPGGPIAVIGTTAILLGACLLTNLVFARLLRVHANPESTLITALILALILGPVSPFTDPRRALVIAAAGAAGIASKYLLAIRRQHLFNPAAVGAAVSGLAFGTFATWWAGNTALLPLVLIGGFLLLRKVSRIRMVGVFLAGFVVFLVAMGVAQGADAAMALQSILFVLGQSSVFFFAVVMLTEPATSPKRFSLQVLYALVAALLYQPQLTILGQNLTPEEALLAANLLSFIVSPSRKLRLRLKERIPAGNGIMSFTFDRPPRFRHRPGQYMEWTLPIAHSDARGDRRHFSIASSPTEQVITIAARFPSVPSRYKQVLSALPVGAEIVASELGGDFTLPEDPGRPLAFFAGGIGITPFRSMLKYCIDKGQKRDIVLVYSSSTEDEIVFQDVLNEARRNGVKIVHTLTDPARVPPDWSGRCGYVDATLIRQEVSRIEERLSFISGSAGFVNAVKTSLRDLKVPRRHVRTDYFPGYSM
jgi:ferredoxin-NADP reductase